MGRSYANFVGLVVLFFVLVGGPTYLLMEQEQRHALERIEAYKVKAG